MIRVLDATTAHRLRVAPLTYAEVGASTRDVLPGGYHHLDRERAFPVAEFERLAECVLAWGLQAGAGLDVRASSPRAVADAVVLMRLGPPVVGIDVPCRVVRVLDEPDRVGFAYGTLPGHPRAGRGALRRRASRRPGGAAHPRLLQPRHRAGPRDRSGGPGRPGRHDPSLPGGRRPILRS